MRIATSKESEANWKLLNHLTCEIKLLYVSKAIIIAFQ